MQIRYLHLDKVEHKLFNRHVVPRSFKFNPLWFNILTVMLKLSPKTIFSTSHPRFSRRFTFFSLSLNLSFRTVIPGTTTVFFWFFTDITRFIISVALSFFCAFIIFQVVGSKMNDHCIKGIVFQITFNMMFPTLRSCARNRFYMDIRFC